MVNWGENLLAWCMRTSKRNAIELWITFWINKTDWQTDDSLLIFELPVLLILLTTKTNQNEKEITNNYDFCFVIVQPLTNYV